MAVDKVLLAVLACPRCRGDVREQGMFLTCAKCKAAYPVLGQDVPDMIAEDSLPLGKARKDKFRHRLSL